MVWVCKKCDATWYYPVSECIYCGSKTTEAESKSYTVKGVTKVVTPSAEHKETPYYVLLLEDEKGRLHIRKSFKEYNLGEAILSHKTEKQTPKLVGVVGTGSMGSDIAQLALQSGCRVILKSRSKLGLNKARDKIEKNLTKSMGTENKDLFLHNIKFTTRFSDLKDSDIIIESVVEDEKVKKDLLKKLDKICSRKTIFASNTSSISIDALSSVVSDQKRVVGMHFFKPATKMRLVEVVSGEKTAEKTVKFTVALAEEMGKIPIVTKDSPGFIVNRILMPYLNEAVYALDEGLGSVEEIDAAAKLGLNNPIGPLALLDLIGLDVFVAIMGNIHRKTKNPKYLPCSRVMEMVKAGQLGRKAGIGFYKY